MEFLSQHGLAFESRDIREDRGALEELRALGVQSTPTLRINDRIMEGFRSDKLLAILAEEGAGEA